MVNNSTNINKMNNNLSPHNNLSPQLIEHIKHNTWHWKSRSWLGKGTKSVAGLNKLMGSQVYTQRLCLVLLHCVFQFKNFYVVSTHLWIFDLEETCNYYQWHVLVSVVTFIFFITNMPATGNFTAQLDYGIDWKSNNHKNKSCWT